MGHRNPAGFSILDTDVAEVRAFGYGLSPVCPGLTSLKRSTGRQTPMGVISSMKLTHANALNSSSSNYFSSYQSSAQEERKEVYLALLFLRMFAVSSFGVKENGLRVSSVESMERYAFLDARFAFSF